MMGKGYKDFSYHTDAHCLYYGTGLKGLAKPEEVFDIWFLWKRKNYKFASFSVISSGYVMLPSR